MRAERQLGVTDKLKMGVKARKRSRYTQNKRIESKNWVWRTKKAVLTPNFELT